MFHPLSLYVGLRYVRARSHKFFVSFITWVSLLGVCLGVTALIVILSVMNGFEGELRDRLISLSSDIRVNATGRESPDWNAVASALRAQPGVRGVAPYAELQALAVRTPEMLPVQLRGIDPAQELQVSDVARAIVEGRLADLQSGSDRVIVGSVIAQQLGLLVGDTITLLVPLTTPDGAPQPVLREFTVAGTFEIGLQDHDGVLVLAALDDVRDIAVSTIGGAGLHVRVDDPVAAPAVAARLRGVVPAGLDVRDWTQDHASYFRAIRIEKTMMALILMLVVAVAAFQIVAMLVMVVTDKRTDIAMLRTLGASPRRVLGVFATQGLAIGWLGVLFGIALGVVISLNVGVIVPWLERIFGFQVMDSDVYYITRVPSELRSSQVLTIGVSALVLTAAATVYPAWRASRVPPAEALRYE